MPHLVHEHGYAPVTHTTGLWKHHTRNITFTLVVDDFGIKYTNLDDVTHLQNALHQQYKITTDTTDPFTVVSHLHGIITSGTSMYPCQVMFNKFCNASNIRIHGHHRIHRINGTNQSTAKKSNTLKTTMTRRSSLQTKSQASNKLSDVFSSMPSSTLSL